MNIFDSLIREYAGQGDRMSPLDDAMSASAAVFDSLGALQANPLIRALAESGLGRALTAVDVEVVLGVTAALENAHRPALTAPQPIPMP